MPWRAASGCTVPARTASELSRLRVKRREHLVHPNAQDAIFFLPDERVCTVSSFITSYNATTRSWLFSLIVQKINYCI